MVEGGSVERVKRKMTHNNKNGKANDNGKEEVRSKNINCISPASPPAGPLLLDIRVRKGGWPELGLRRFVVGRERGGGCDRTGDGNG